jgi:hypothetical protein
MEFSGCVSCTISGNVIAHAANNSLFFESQGIQGGAIFGNVISNSPRPRLWPGAHVCECDWWGQISGPGRRRFSWARVGDTTGAGLPVTALPTQTATATATASPTATSTATVLPSDTPTATETETATPTETSTQPMPDGCVRVGVEVDGESVWVCR